MTRESETAYLRKEEYKWSLHRAVTPALPPRFFSFAEWTLYSYKLTTTSIDIKMSGLYSLYKCMNALFLLK